MPRAVNMRATPADVGVLAAEPTPFMRAPAVAGRDVDNVRALELDQLPPLSSW